ncbi:MAG: hypothetical protein RI925_2198 [Pseudomonadota bacterium]|jgi:UDP-glucose 4-epimerase
MNASTILDTTAMQNSGWILVTGGAGYIGAHTCVALLEAGHQVLVFDSLVNGSTEALARASALGGGEIAFVQGDVRDRAALDALFARYPVSAVLHLAGVKAVGESVRQPLHYYEVNVSGSLSLLQAMDAAGVHTLVFSSSATVYGAPVRLPIDEQAALGPSNPYGRSKLMVEDQLRDLCAAQPHWRVAILRYFNPVGAHPSGQLGEDPHGTPDNLMPFVSQVAVGRRAELAVFGNDYPTPDGTGVRDYLHVCDLARGHVAALKALPVQGGLLTVNLGTGRGHSVLDVVRAFEAASGQTVPLRFAPRRPGDIAACWADPSRAEQLLGWRAECDLDAMCRDVWRWQRGNPQGYR